MTVYHKLVENLNVTRTNDSSSLVKKDCYNRKNDEIEQKMPEHNKYITTREFNRLTAETLLKD